MNAFSAHSFKIIEGKIETWLTSTLKFQVYIIFLTLYIRAVQYGTIAHFEGSFWHTFKVFPAASLKNIYIKRWFTNSLMFLWFIITIDDIKIYVSFPCKSCLDGKKSNAKCNIIYILVYNLPYMGLL